MTAKRDKQSCKSETIKRFIDCFLKNYKIDSYISNQQVYVTSEKVLPINSSFIKFRREHPLR